MKGSDSDYIHGTDPDEQHRLSKLNALLNANSLRVMALGGGEKVLDVGSRLGQFTRMMARTVGSNGRVVDVERIGMELERVRSRTAQDIADRLTRAAADFTGESARQGDDHTVVVLKFE